jgi:hypothetical protein
MTPGLIQFFTGLYLWDSANGKDVEGLKIAAR